MKQLRPCSGCEEYCLHKDSNSFLKGKIRMCPSCGSVCIERGATNWANCLQCGAYLSSRKFWVKYDPCAVQVAFEHPDD